MEQLGIEDNSQILIEGICCCSSCCCYHCCCCYHSCCCHRCCCYAFSALTLLVVWQEGHSACKKIQWWDAGMVMCMGQGADLHMAQLMLLPLTVSCSSKSRLVLPFWCRLTWVVTDRIQEGCRMVVCVCCHCCCHCHCRCHRHVFVVVFSIEVLGCFRVRTDPGKSWY